MEEPKLRFQREDGTSYPEWETLTLGDRFAFKNGINASREAFRTAGINCIGVSDIIKCLPILADNVIGTVAISDDEIEKNKVNYGDILFQRSSETQEDIGHASVYVDKKPSVYNGFVICGKPNELFYDPVFLHNSLQHSRVRKQTISLGAGAQHYNIGQESLAKINIVFPCLEEQKKIADFFSAIDGIIAQSEAEVQNLEQQKKIVVQKIFSQEVRFRREDGTEFPEWEETSFGNTCSGFEYGMNAAACSYDGMHKYIRITDIDDTSRRYLSENAVSPNGKMQDKYIVNINDILFARTGASVGKAYLYREGDGLLYYAGFLIRANVNDDNNAYFIFSQTLTSDYSNWVKLTSMRTGQQGINAQEYRSYKFYAPCLEEQKKIADFLSAYDEAIIYAKQELDKWKELKNGLLQQMFA